MCNKKIKKIIEFIVDLYGHKYKDYIPLHSPAFLGNEERYVVDTIKSTYVSYIGEYVKKFETKVAQYTNSKYAIATVSGTAALHTALIIAGVKYDDEVITQPLTFVATCNAIRYCGAYPIFVDVSMNTMGMCPESLNNFLEKYVVIKKDGFAYNKITGRRIIACVPVHIFGHPVEIDKITELCSKYNINVIEDSAESLGSFYKNKHTGTFGIIGILSFNGNKIITTGGGGMVLTSNTQYAEKAKHITTTAKVPHKYEYFHNEVGYNYRMPNINAALGLAQLENLERIIEIKRNLAKAYEKFFENIEGIKFIKEPKYSRSNYWLNTILFEDISLRNKFLEISNEKGIQTRAVWKLMYKLPMYKDCFRVTTPNAEFLEKRLVNLPSGIP